MTKMCDVFTVKILKFCWMKKYASPLIDIFLSQIIQEKKNCMVGIFLFSFNKV